MTSGRTQAVLIGGAFNGVLSALPIVGAANVCCCLWVVGGGAITAWLMHQGRTMAMRVADGAIGGALAGLAGAFFYTVVDTPISIAMAPEANVLAELAGGDIPPEVIQFYEMVSNSVVLRGSISFLLWLLVGVVFSTGGGLLGVLFIQRDAPPPVPPVASGGLSEGASSAGPVVPPPPIAPDA